MITNKQITMDTKVFRLKDDNESLRAFIILTYVNTENEVIVESVVVTLEGNGISHVQMKHTYYPIDKNIDLSRELIDSIFSEELFYCKKVINGLLSVFIPESTSKKLSGLDHNDLREIRALGKQLTLREIKEVIVKFSDGIMSKDLLMMLPKKIVYKSKKVYNTRRYDS